MGRYSPPKGRGDPNSSELAELVHDPPRNEVVVVVLTCVVTLSLGEALEVVSAPEDARCDDGRPHVSFGVAAGLRRGPAHYGTDADGQLASPLG